MSYHMEELLTLLNEKQLETHIQFLSNYGLSQRVTNMFEKKGITTIRDSISFLVYPHYIKGIGQVLLDQLEEAIIHFANNNPVRLTRDPSKEEIKKACEEIQDTWTEEEREKRVVDSSKERVELKILPYPKFRKKPTH